MPGPWQMPRRARHVGCRALEGDGSLVPLGLDFLTFLATTVLVIPLFKSVKASPILGCVIIPRARATTCHHPPAAYSR